MPLQQLIQLIDRHFEALSPELQRAARWVREHPSALGLQSMRQTAQAAGVAPATMTRLAHALGVGGFEGLRAPVRVHLADASRRSTPLNAVLPAGEVPQALGQLVRAQMANVRSIENNPPATLQAAAQAVLTARSVAFLGSRASHGVVQSLQYTCDWLRSGTWLVADLANAALDRLNDLDDADLLVVVSQAPYTRTVVEATQRAHGRGIPVLALTDSDLSPLAKAAHWVLHFESESTGFFHSTTGAQALGEALLNEVALQGGSLVAERLALRQERHREARTYWTRAARPPRVAKRRS